MTSVTFQEVLTNLNKGLEELLNKKPATYNESLENKRKVEIQKTKIMFLKKGYAFKERELKPQQTLK